MGLPIGVDDVQKSRKKTEEYPGIINVGQETWEKQKESIQKTWVPRGIRGRNARKALPGAEAGPER
jgi:hypothetical protein